MIRGGVQHLVDKIRDLIYPVNSLYISTSATSPASYFGGSWERYGTGRALISASDTDTDFKAGTTGGSKTHEHKLPTLYGKFLMSGTEIRACIKNLPDAVPWRANVHSSNNVYADTSVVSDGLEIYRPSNDTIDEGASSLEPYVAVYVWRRTA